uniref:Uncharacterized protein n=1 Tax=Glossina palpalis gambiensis TaxID=67801 RepID=A0A1B0BTM5_9MUSC
MLRHRDLTILLRLLVQRYRERYVCNDKLREAGATCFLKKAQQDLEDLKVHLKALEDLRVELTKCVEKTWEDTKKLEQKIKGNK